MKRTSLIFAVTAILLLALVPALAGCGNAATTTATTSGGTGGGAGGGSGSNTTASAAGYQIPVTRDGSQVGALDLDMLHGLPVVNFNKSTGELEEGPTLLSALELVGITDFTSVTIEGWTKGRVATAELTLQRAEVTQNTILEFNKQGKTKLAGKEIPEDSWIVDVSGIKVQ